MESRKAIIVGAGASGVGLGVLFKQLQFDDFVILEKESIGSTFLKWPQEMKFITPSFTGHGFGALDLNAVVPNTSPAYMFSKEHLSGREYAEYLRLVADHFALPVQQAAVNKVEKQGGLFKLHTDKGLMEAEYVVWATGEYQTPNADPFPGAAQALHNSRVPAWHDLRGDRYTVIGGYESGVDAAYHLVKNGKSVSIIAVTATWDEDEADPSLSLSPYTHERFRDILRTGRLSLAGGVEVLQLTKQKDEYRLHLSDGTTHISETRPILATGFIPGARRIGSLFEWGEDDMPVLTETDESTVTSNLFLVGPNVRHSNVIFCFIYKFRQRFAVVAQEIIRRCGFEYSEEVFEHYRRNQMFLDDLSCCEVACEC